MSSPPAPPPRPIGARARIAVLRAQQRGPDDQGGTLGGNAPPGEDVAVPTAVMIDGHPVCSAPAGGWVPDRGRRHGAFLRHERHAALRSAGNVALPEGIADNCLTRSVDAPLEGTGTGDSDAGGASGHPDGAVAADGVAETIGSHSDGDDGGDGSGDGDGSGEIDDASGRPAWTARLVRRGPWGALAERWVPEPLRGARIDPGRRGAVLLSVVAALAAIVAAVGVWWGRPQPRPVTPVALAPASTGDTASPTAVPNRVAAGELSPVSGAGAAGADRTAPPASSASPASPMPTGPILVSVTGKVRHPGVVTVPARARVADAIQAAGGPLDAADLTGLNLAAHLSDGDSVVVGGPAGGSVRSESTAGAAASAAPPGASGVPESIDLNTADQAMLEELPGVGPVTAAAIISWRTDHGSFTSIDQLQAVSGIGPATYAKIAPHVTV